MFKNVPQRLELQPNQKIERVQLGLAGAVVDLVIVGHSRHDPAPP